MSRRHSPQSARALAALLAAALAAALLLLLPSATLARPAGSFAPLVLGPASSGAQSAPALLAALALQQAELTAPDGVAGDDFGSAVALSGDTALVGADGHTVGGTTDQGAAYVFTLSGTTWSWQATLTASDGAAKDGFGSAVALDGDTAVIGASGKTIADHDLAGAAYVFVRSGATWTQQAEFTDPAARSYDAFGGSVALQGDTALIAGWGTGDLDQEDQMTGMVYVFARTGSLWTQQAALKDPDDSGEDEFGCSVALNGDTALIGADGNDSLGAAYVYARSGSRWSLRQSLFEPNMTSNEATFGSDVAFSSDAAIITDPDLAGGGVSDMYVLNNGKLRYQQTLRDSGPVALSATLVVIGGSRTVDVYERAARGWTRTAELLEPPAADGHSFGAALALSGTTALIGDPGGVDGTHAYDGTAWAQGLSSLPVTTLKATASSVWPGQRVTLTGRVANVSTGQNTVTICRQLKHHKLELLKKVSLTRRGSYSWTLRPGQPGTWALVATYKVGGVVSPSPLVSVRVR